MDISGGGVGCRSVSLSGRDAGGAGVCVGAVGLALVRPQRSAWTGPEAKVTYTPALELGSQHVVLENALAGLAHLGVRKYPVPYRLGAIDLAIIDGARPGLNGYTVRGSLLTDPRCRPALDRKSVV